MLKKTKAPYSFHSILAPQMEQFLQEKHACGHYLSTSSASEYYLHDLDCFLIAEGWNTRELPREIVKRWVAKRTHERPRTHSVRSSTIRQFALFLCRIEIPSYVLSWKTGPISQNSFAARIFTKDEIRNLLTAIDAMTTNNCSPHRSIILPELFRLLYCCGLRVSEALRLKVEDVDLKSGILTVRDTKFGKHRFVPLSVSMTERLRVYESMIQRKSDNHYYFPSNFGGCYTKSPIYVAFRKALSAAGIPHHGRGHGPRMHDLRHTFAVHRLEAWYREGVDLNAKLPILSAYLGHRNLSGTQKYLQLTAELFPDLTSRSESFLGHIIPRRTER